MFEQLKADCKCWVHVLVDAPVIRDKQVLVQAAVKLGQSVTLLCKMIAASGLKETKCGRCGCAMLVRQCNHESTKPFCMKCQPHLSVFTYSTEDYMNHLTGAFGSMNSQQIEAMASQIQVDNALSEEERDDLLELVERARKS